MKIPQPVENLIVRVGVELVEALANAILGQEDPTAAIKRAAHHAALREGGHAALDEMQRRLGKD